MWTATLQYYRPMCLLATQKIRTATSRFIWNYPPNFDYRDEAVAAQSAIFIPSRMTKVYFPFIQLSFFPTVLKEEDI